jgi:hypothetical protein
MIGVETRIGDFASSDHGETPSEPPTFGYLKSLLKARPKRLLKTIALISPFETQQ